MKQYLISILIGGGDCKKQLVFGDESKVKDELITASSIWENQASNYGPQRAPINDRSYRCQSFVPNIIKYNFILCFDITSFLLCFYRGFWVAAELNLKQWIQVEFITPYKITAIQTQGRTNLNQWLKSYKVSYSYNMNDWKIYTDKSGLDKVIFTALISIATLVFVE